MRRTGKKASFYFLCGLFCTFISSAGTLDITGVATLRAVSPGITGTGIRVGTVENIIDGANAFEVNPAEVGQPVSLFTWYSFSGTATTFPNSVGTESWHADIVGKYFFGTNFGAAPGVSHVDNYEANYFVSVIQGGATVPAKIISQSFVFDRSSEQAANSLYDDYAVAKGTLFVSAVGNDGAPYAPGAAYNSIGVGALGTAASSSVGPTSNGRCKPDIVAPEEFTSYSTPQVAGAAALLMQTGNALTNPAAANDIRTQKALLLNGAVKPLAWTNSPAHPLDFRYGAGMVNVFNSWKQMTSGRFAPVETSSNAANATHPPGTSPNNLSTNIGWDFNSITNQRVGPDLQERVNHYYFTIPAGPSATLTATLAWNLRSGTTNLNDLDLFLYNCANSNLVALSTSRVDNVEHLFLPSLPAGRYDLQVLKKTNGPSTNETYALALETFKQTLSIVRSSTNVVVSWPVHPDGFVLESASALGSTNTWSTVAATSVVTNNLRRVVLPASGNQFYRLRRP